MTGYLDRWVLCLAWGVRDKIWVTQKPREDYFENSIAPKFKEQDSIMILGEIVGGKDSCCSLE